MHSGLKINQNHQRLIAAKSFGRLLRIEGRPFNGEPLTYRKLKKFDLLPRHRIQINGREIFLSRPYYCKSADAIAYTAYVESGAHYAVRTFFYSRSQAVGRVLIGYSFFALEIGEKVVNHNKGYSEQSLYLPTEIQKFMAEHMRGKNLRQGPDLAFYGTANDGSSMRSYRQKISPRPVRLRGNFYSTRAETKINPIKMSFRSKSDEPDFKNFLESWSFKTELYGAVRALVFYSQNRRFKYQFNISKTGLAWLAGIETEGALTDFGLVNNWVDAGDLATPPLEYQSIKRLGNKVRQFDRTGGFGNSRSRKGPYVDMTKHYLNRVPIIMSLKKHLGDDCLKPVKPRPLGRFWKVDANGFIQSDASMDKIQKPWRAPVVLVTKHLMNAKSVQAVYLRGSVSRGLAIKNLSDLDFIYFSDRRCDSMEEKVAQLVRTQFPFVQKIELIRVNPSSVPPRIQVVLKTQSVLIAGRDFTSHIKPIKAGSKMATNISRLNAEFKDLSNWIKHHRKHGRERSIREWFSRLIVRAGFELTLDRERQFTTDLYLCYQVFSKYYPLYKHEMFEVLTNSLNGDHDPRRFKDLVEFIQRESRRLKIS